MMMRYSVYLYSISLCQHLSFEAQEDFIATLRNLFSQIKFVEGSNQFGRAVFTSDIAKVMNSFADEYASVYPNVRTLSAYFSKLNEGEYFYLIDGTFPVLNRQIAIIWLKAHSEGLDPQKQRDKFLFSHGLLRTRFEYYSYGFDNIPVFVGEDDKAKRICRFCKGKTKFGKKTNAHAISDALGNKILFCLEECMSCNERLSKVERNFINLMDWRRSMMGIPNKDNRYAAVFGKEGALRFDDEGNRVLYIDEDVINAVPSGEKFSIRLNNKKIITDQGIYKALCKYVINLIPSRYLSHFAQTIDWINGNLYETKLPEVLEAYQMPFRNQPILDIYIKKDNDPNTPFCTAMLFVCDICYMYILPLVDVDGVQFITKAALLKHWSQFIKTYPRDWKSIDMSNYGPSNPWVDLRLSIDDPRIKVVPHGDPRLRQSVSEPKPRAKVKKELTEYVFPDFDMNCIRYEGTDVTKFRVHHSGYLPADALHNTTIEVRKQLCEISLVDNRAKVIASFIVRDSVGKNAFFEFEFSARFSLIGADCYISVSDGHLALDYHLSEALYYTACLMSEMKFKTKVQNTPFSICSLEKTLCEDKRTISHLNYKLITAKGIFLFNDAQIHGNPFDI